jgi:hypothetical protein
LKSEIKSLKIELAIAKSMKKTDETEIDQQKKKFIDNSLISTRCEPFNVIPFHHRYSIGHIIIYITFVLSAATSLRCASRVFEIMMNFLKIPLPSPSWYSGRLWLLRSHV